MFLLQAYRLWGSVRRDQASSSNADEMLADDYSPATLRVSMQLFHGSISYLAIIFLLVGISPFVL